MKDNEFKFLVEYNTQLILDRIDNYLHYNNAFYVVDDYFKHLFINKKNVFFVKATEENKNINTVNLILDQLFSNGLNRKDIIIAIGGGLTLDIAAYCASIYKRGCLLYFIPTTLIGMIDAAIGGKTGVNYKNLKNQIGSFYPAHKVIIDFDLLKSLPEREIRNGYAELIKMMIIFEREFFNKDFNYIRDNLLEYIKKAINYKACVCAKDLTDKNERQLLNLGHSFAHLLETVSNFRLSHGEAVAKGLYLALKFSYQKNVLSEIMYRKILTYINEFCANIEILPDEIERIKQHGEDILLADKKNDETFKLILVNDISVELRNFGAPTS